MHTILDDVKKVLGIDQRYTHFDPDIIMHINSTFMVLNQMGVGINPPCVIVDGTETWEQFFGDNSSVELVKSYVYLKVRLLFDPPQSSTTMEAIKNLTNEFEFRLNVACDDWGVNNV